MLQDLMLNCKQKEYLLSVAHLVWWMSAAEAIKDVPFLLRQVMVFGDLEQTIGLEDLFSKEYLIEVLKDAPCGQLNPRSWHFWHYRLLHCELGEVPPMPKRFE